MLCGYGDFRQHIGEVLLHLIRSAAEKSNSVALNQFLPETVLFPDIFALVIATIYFNRKTQLMAIEIKDIRPYSMLAQKFQAI